MSHRPNPCISDISGCLRPPAIRGGPPRKPGLEGGGGVLGFTPTLLTAPAKVGLAMPSQDKIIITLMLLTTEVVFSESLNEKRKRKKNAYARHISIL